MSYLEALNWRYATKQMNGARVDAQAIERVKEAIRLAPTSYGLQAFKVLSIQGAEMKAKIAEACFNQPQIATCDTVLIFAVYKTGYEVLVEEYAALIAETRGQKAEDVEPFKNVMLQVLGSLSDEVKQTWASKSAYLALGIALQACALEGLDSTPMEGFNAAALDEVLGLEAKNLHSTVVLAIGKRDAEKDYLNGAAKVRKATEQLFENLD